MIRRNGTAIEFYNNNVLLVCFNSGGTEGCQASANIPTSVQQPILNIKPTAASARNFDVDYARLIDVGIQR
jgi:hypothetical protein